MLPRLSLRARLLLGLVVLAAAGLAAADTATYTSLRSFLLARVDKQLEAGHTQVEHNALDGSDGPNGHADHAAPGGARGARGGPPAEGIDWYQVRTLSGSVLAGGFLVGGGSPPTLPASIDVPTGASTPSGERVGYFTVSSKNGSTTYRVRASVDPERPTRVLVVATSLHDLGGTVHRLLLIELLVTAAVLAALGGVGLWVVRLGLRPLRGIETTAAMIAAGDLTQRVELAEPTTEVGRLGLSLNAMLARIESAFEARRRSEEKLRRFVADASHELRTPLAAVRAYAELFGRGAAERPEDLARAMGGITREAERMTLLVDDLLLLARLDEGRPLEQAHVDLAALVTEAVDAARIVDPDRIVEVRVAPATVVGDRDRLRQVLDNLFANVRAHTPAGTPVAVGLRAGDGRAELTVSDQGPGLTDEEAVHVFERFFRVDSSRARANGGVGLGLSIVAAIAHAHGGAAAAKPAPSGGASFVVTLPLAVRAA